MAYDVGVLLGCLAAHEGVSFLEDLGALSDDIGRPGCLVLHLVVVKFVIDTILAHSVSVLPFLVGDLLQEHVLLLLLDLLPFQEGLSPVELLLVLALCIIQLRPLCSSPLCLESHILRIWSSCSLHVRLG